MIERSPRAAAAALTERGRLHRTSRPLSGPRAVAAALTERCSKASIYASSRIAGIVAWLSRDPERNLHARLASVFGGDVWPIAQDAGAARRLSASRPWMPARLWMNPVNDMEINRLVPSSTSEPSIPVREWPLPGPRNVWLGQRQKTVLRPLQMTIDGGLAVGLLLLLAHSRPGDLDVLYSLPAVVSVLLMIIFYSYFGVYHFFADRFATVMRLTKAWWMVVFTLLLVAFITKTSAQFSRELALLWVTGAYCLQLVAHLLVPMLLRLADLRRRRVKARAIVVGASTLGYYLAQRINKNPWNHIQVVGVVDDDELALRRWVLDGVPVLGGSRDLGPLIEANSIEVVYLALSLSMSPSLERIYTDLARISVDVY